MMQKEFEKRAKFEVSADCYHKCIEPEYNASKLDKDEWVKEWKKNGGIQKAYNWERMNRQQAEKEAKTSHAIAKSVAEERDFYMTKTENLEKGHKALVEESKEMDDKLAEATDTYMQLAEFIAKVGTEYQDKPMLRKAKEILGAKRYITFKLTNNIELPRKTRSSLWRTWDKKETEEPTTPPQNKRIMVLIEARTYVSEEILLNEYEYTYGTKKDEKVDFTFVNVKRDKENTKRGIFTYREALGLARWRRNDGRYKNYEFEIG